MLLKLYFCIMNLAIIMMLNFNERGSGTKWLWYRADKMYMIMLSYQTTLELCVAHCHCVHKYIAPVNSKTVLTGDCSVCCGRSGISENTFPIAASSFGMVDVLASVLPY